LLWRVNPLKIALLFTQDISDLFLDGGNGFFMNKRNFFGEMIGNIVNDFLIAFEKFFTKFLFIFIKKF